MNTNTSIKIAVTILALLGTAGAAKADPGAASCSARLNALSAEWDAISFQPPSKPSQARVVGRNGHELSGGQYAYIQGRIRIAAQACRAGNADLAEQQISYARTLLAQTAGYDAAPTGSIGQAAGRHGVGEDRSGRCTIWNAAHPTALGYHPFGRGKGC